MSITENQIQEAFDLQDSVRDLIPGQIMKHGPSTVCSVYTAIAVELVVISRMSEIEAMALFRRIFRAYTEKHQEMLESLMDGKGPAVRSDPDPTSN